MATPKSNAQRKLSLAASRGSANFVRIWGADDGGRSSIHLISTGNDYTICGHDIAGDDMVHLKPPKELDGAHRVTCPQCLQIIADVAAYLNSPNDKLTHECPP